MATFTKSRWNGKAGIAGLFCCALLSLAMPAAADPLVLRIMEAKTRIDPEHGGPIVVYYMSPADRKVFAEFTAHNIGRKMTVRVDGKVVAEPMIRQQVKDGTGLVPGLTQSEAAKLVDKLIIGAKIEVDLVKD